MFLTHHAGLNNLGRGSIILLNHIKICPVVSDKKIFKVFYIHVDIEGK